MLLSQTLELGFHFSLSIYVQDAVKCEGPTEMNICILLWNHVASVGRNSVFGVVRTGRSGDRIPVVARFSAPVQTGPEAYSASYAMGTGSFPGVMRPMALTSNRI